MTLPTVRLEVVQGIRKRWNLLKVVMNKYQMDLSEFSKKVCGWCIKNHLGVFKIPKSLFIPGEFWVSTNTQIPLPFVWIQNTLRFNKYTETLTF